MIRHFLNYTLVLLILASCFAPVSQASEACSADCYQKGLDLKTSGDWFEALQIWLAGARSLQREQKSDPRIAIAFIELTTAQKARNYYELACEMYLWGFSQNNLQGYKTDVEKEVERIAPLVGKDMVKKWHLLLDNGDSQLFNELISFWSRKDPTFSTKFNERLIEHWERIAYARSNFRKGNSTAYGTDDRGLIYVKYGEPGRIKTGFLGNNRAEMKRWTDVVLANQNAIVSTDFTSAATSAADQTSLLQTVDRFNNSPEYEIWLYYSSNFEEPIFFLFGNLEGVGSFGLRNGIEEFIPRRAFFKSSTTSTAGILPGAILQASYYSKLAHVHPYFEDRFYETEYMWDLFASRGGAAILQFNNTVKSKRQLFEGLDRVHLANAYAPPDKSSFEETVSAVELVVHPFRFLGDKQKPKLALIAFSYPKIKAKFFNLTSSQVEGQYSTTHTLIIYDKSKQEIKRLSDSMPGGVDNMSAFILPHEPNQHEYRLFSEVFKLESVKAESGQAGQPEGSPQAIGVGRTSISRRPPLSSTAARLELSDLLVGVNIPDELQSDRLPFPLVPIDKIQASDLLIIYLEIYHLNLDADGMGHFTIDFEAARLKGQKKSKKESISLSFNFDSANRTTKETFEVDISKLKQGNYELRVHVTDTVSMQQMHRKARFEVN